MGATYSGLEDLNPSPLSKKWVFAEQKKFRILQKYSFSGRDFEVYDSKGFPILTTQGKLFSIDGKMLVYNSKGIPEFVIKRKPFSFRTCYKIFSVKNDNEPIASIYRKMFTATSLNYRLCKGDALAYTTKVGLPRTSFFFKNRNGRILATAQRKLFSLNNSFVLNTQPEVDSLFFILATIIVDFDVEQQNIYNSAENSEIISF